MDRNESIDGAITEELYCPVIWYLWFFLITKSWNVGDKSSLNSTAYVYESLFLPLLIFLLRLNNLKFVRMTEFVAQKSEINNFYYDRLLNSTSSKCTLRRYGFTMRARNSKHNKCHLQATSDIFDDAFPHFLSHSHRYRHFFSSIHISNLLCILLLHTYARLGSCKKSNETDSRSSVALHWWMWSIAFALVIHIPSIRSDIEWRWKCMMWYYDSRQPVKRSHRHRRTREKTSSYCVGIPGLLSLVRNGNG